MVHYPRSVIETVATDGEPVVLRLRDGDTAWWQGRQADGGDATVTGPGVVTYRMRPNPDPIRGGLVLGMAGFDPVAADGDPRCEEMDANADRCLLIDGDHLTHYYPEDNA